MLRKKLLNYDISKDILFFKQIEANYQIIEQNTLEHRNLTNKLVPIFIVGMPRSGTTLVEQIISSHSKVTGAGELKFVSQFGGMIARGLTVINTNFIMDFRKRYLMNLKSISMSNQFVTDKMPQNFLFLGLIAAAFPESKIIHVKRDPAAVCWANYKQYFTSKSLSYCYDLNDITKYHSLYLNLMEFWEKKLIDRIYNL